MFLRKGKFFADLFHRLAVQPFQVLNVTDKLSCTIYCLGRNECLSFNLAVIGSNGVKLCELLPTDKYALSGAFQPSPDFDLYSVDIGMVCRK